MNMNQKHTLLIVDDEEEIRENLKDFAEFKGFTVLEAGNGREALAHLETHQPDLIISDLMMPEIGGLQLLQELAKRDVGIPVVIMTAFGTMEYAIDAMKNGAADFLTKPIDLSYMMQVVDKILKRSAMERKVKEQQRQLEEDLRHAATIQRCLLPEAIETTRFSFHYRYEPLIAIGGDYLTVHQYSADKVAIALYDVSGHGVSAALTANMVHNQLQQRLAEHRPPSNVIDLLNRFIIRNIGESSMFITMGIVIIDWEEETMRFANAGHPDLLIWRDRERTLQTISSHTPPVGMTPNILGDQNETNLKLAGEDRIILYTDGFLERRNAEGKMLGSQGFQELIKTHCRLRPTDFLRQILDDIDRYSAEAADDDLTLVVVDVK
ncbi:MAG: response regulator [Candidatus Omnitrophota bacterium]|jgi:serine phosphatase RsbU (regulator of sigma subunit)|nr:MAG: response regulator [Candidatus Omnitrophota bacterium]